MIPPTRQTARTSPTDPNAGKIQPDRRWFGNVRTVDQKELENYRRKLEEDQQKKGSGVSVLVKNKKLPLSLVKDAFNSTLGKGERLLQVETFQDTFGPTQRRKRPNIGTSCMDEMLQKANDTIDDYDPVKDNDLNKHIVKDAKDAA